MDFMEKMVASSKNSSYYFLRQSLVIPSEVKHENFCFHLLLHSHLPIWLNFFFLNFEVD